MCGFRKVLHYDEINRLYKCVPCGRCPVGYKLNYKCNSQTILSSKEDVTTNRCLPCNEDPHHITAYSPGGLRCFPCKRSCGINGEIERPCSLGKNTQCRCKFNYYRHPITGKCLHQCIKCPEGRKFELVNQECVNYNNGKVGLVVSSIF